MNNEQSKGDQLYNTAGRFCFAHLQGKVVMSMGRRKKPETLDELQTEVERAEKELHYLENKQKIQEKQAKELTRKARTRRLCTRAGMLESFLERPEDLTDDQVMELLRIAFRDQKVRSRLEEMLQENSS